MMSSSRLDKKVLVPTRKKILISKLKCREVTFIRIFVIPMVTHCHTMLFVDPIAIVGIIISINGSLYLSMTKWQLLFLYIFKFRSNSVVQIDCSCCWLDKTKGIKVLTNSFGLLIKFLQVLREHGAEYLDELLVRGWRQVEGVEARQQTRRQWGPSTAWWPRRAAEHHVLETIWQAPLAIMT